MSKSLKSLKSLKMLSLVAVAVMATGCAQNPLNLPVYSAGAANSAADGLVVSVTRVADIMVEEDKPAGYMQVIAGVAGGVLGNALGSAIGNGSGQDLAKTVGTIGGGAAGAMVAGQKKLVPGVEVTFVFADPNSGGRTMQAKTIRQAKSVASPKAGDKAVWTRGGGAGDRVIPLT